MLSRLSGIYRLLKNWPRYSDKAGIWSRKELTPDKEPHSPMAHHDSTDSRATHQVLGVDDAPSIRLLCVTSLTKAGYQVLEAEGSSEAIITGAGR